MFLYCFVCTGLVFLCHGCVSLMKYPMVSVLASVNSTLSTPSTWVTKVPFPQTTVTQSKFLCRLPFLSMFHTLEHNTFPNWVFLVAHFTGTITFLFCGLEIRFGWALSSCISNTGQTMINFWCLYLVLSFFSNLVTQLFNRLHVSLFFNPSVVLAK